MLARYLIAVECEVVETQYNTEYPRLVGNSGTARVGLVPVLCCCKLMIPRMSAAGGLPKFCAQNLQGGVKDEP
jgi:hypothetical protein